MDKQELNKVKDYIYETEGLLELLCMRPEKFEELSPLIMKRLEMATSKFAEISGATTDTSNELSVTPIGYASTFPPAYVDTSEADDNRTVIVRQPEPGSQADEDLTGPTKLINPAAGPSGHTMIPPSNLFEDETRTEIVGRPDKKHEAAEAQQESTSTDNGTPSSAKPAFCLNDRFRFRRAIFGGSDSEFDKAMDDVAAMGDYEEAEVYFFGYRGLDADDADVADFMQIIKAYFER